MADNPKLDDMSSSAAEACVLGEDSGTQKISLLDHVNGFHYNALKKSDNFVIDMNTFSHRINKDYNANSRITKSLSRKGSQRGCAGGGGAEKKSNSNANDRDAATLSATSSPRGTGTPEKVAMAAVGITDHSSSPQVHHQITIATGNIITTPDSKSGFRRNSFKRSSHSWALDPKRVLLFFATLSSMGTILLIYFTLSLKYRADENTSDYKSLISTVVS